MFCPSKSGGVLFLHVFLCLVELFNSVPGSEFSRAGIHPTGTKLA